MTSSSGTAGPSTHYELFAGLRDAGISYLLTGATALVLHGVPRLTPDVDLVIDTHPANIVRLKSLLAAWGYGEPAPPAVASAETAVLRFHKQQSPLGAIDVIPVPTESFSRLRAGAVVAPLVDIGIPFVGAADLLSLKERGDTGKDRDDAEGLRVLATIRAGGTGSETDTRREQIRKFSRWSVAARLDWLLAAARLALGLSPEARPLTRGLVRRHGWYGHRDGR